MPVITQECRTAPDSDIRFGGAVSGGGTREGLTTAHRNKMRQSPGHRTMTSAMPRRSGSKPRMQRSKKSSKSNLFGGDTSGRVARDPVALYLDEIGRYPRLTREEEAALSARALDGDKEAQDRLVNCNLRLVVSIAKGFARGPFTLLDMVSVGNEGLIVASQKYDATTGVPFANYSSYWIKQRIMKYQAEQGASVRIPPYRAAIVNKVVRVNGKLRQVLGREPTPEEVVEQTNCSLDEVREVMRIMQPAMELDAPLSKEDDGATFGSYFGETAKEADEREHEDLAEIDMRRAVRKALGILSPRDAQVLTWYFGLNGTRALDLDQIAERLGVTRERARQIRSAAVKQLAEDGGLDAYQD